MVRNLRRLRKIANDGKFAQRFFDDRVFVLSRTIAKDLAEISGQNLGGNVRIAGLHTFSLSLICLFVSFWPSQAIMYIPFSTKRSPFTVTRYSGKPRLVPHFGFWVILTCRFLRRATLIKKLYPTLCWNDFLRRSLFESHVARLLQPGRGSREF